MTTSSNVSFIRKGRLPDTDQAGMALIESLVSLLILALGVLAMLGVQLRSMSENQAANNRVLASRLADDLIERMKANPLGLTQATAYSLGSSWGQVSAPSVLCTASTGCTPAQQALYDLWAWQTSARNTLPGGNATTFQSPSDPTQIGVMVAWRAREKGDDASSEFAARVAMYNVDVSGGATCPTNSICHLAYGQP